MTAGYVRTWSLPPAEMGHTPSRRRRPLLPRPFVEKIIAGGVAILSLALKLHATGARYHLTGCWRSKKAAPGLYDHTATVSAPSRRSTAVNGRPEG